MLFVDDDTKKGDTTNLGTQDSFIIHLHMKSDLPLEKSSYLCEVGGTLRLSQRPIVAFFVAISRF